MNQKLHAVKPPLSTNAMLPLVIDVMPSQKYAFAKKNNLPVKQPFTRQIE